MSASALARNILRSGMAALIDHTVFSKRSKVRSVGYEVLSRHQPMLVCTSDKGEKFIVKAGDEWIGRDLFISGTSDFAKFEVALALAGKHRPGWKPETLIDVGANIGTICIPAVMRGHVERAIGIEAEPDNARILRANAVLNGLEERITVVEAAAGLRDGETLTLETDPKNFGDHRIRVSDVAGVQGEARRGLVTVTSSKLDTLMAGVAVEHCFVWMDVQGYEGTVLSGAPEMLKAKPPMVVEFCPYLMARAGTFASLCSAVSGYDGFIDLSAAAGLQPIATLPALRDSFTGHYPLETCRHIAYIVSMKTKAPTLRQFQDRFPTEDSCLDHLFQVRYGTDFNCPKCERPAKYSRVKGRRAYQCNWCANQLYPTAGTPFDKTRTSLRDWFFVMFLFTSSRHGVAAKEVERQIGVTYKTAWRMCDQIRKYMTAIDGFSPLGGEGKTVEIDETLLGGRMPGSGRGRHLENKTVILGMVERDGDIVTKIVPNVKTSTLLPEVKATVVEGTAINTDGLHSYKSLGKHGFTHAFVDHNRGEYVRGACHTQTIEGFWAQLKRGINGTHIHVSAKHLPKYLGEFEYRWNMRREPHLMLDRLLYSFTR